MREVWSLDNAALAELLAAGHPIAPEELCGSYRGISLGLPAFVDKVAWKAFRKVFQRGPDGVVGHNVRVHQPAAIAPLDGGRAEPLMSGGRPVTFGPFRVRAMPPDDPFACRSGVLLDYGAAHPRWHPFARLRDPLVALDVGSTELLLGASWLALGLRVRTPSFFTLEREAA